MFNMLTLFITLAQNHFIVFVEKVKMTPKCPKNQNEQLRYKRKHQKEKKKKKFVKQTYRTQQISRNNPKPNY